MSERAPRASATRGQVAISISKTAYDRLRQFAIRHRTAMSSLVDQDLRRMLGLPPVPVRRVSRKLAGNPTYGGAGGYAARDGDAG